MCSTFASMSEHPFWSGTIGQRSAFGPDPALSPGSCRACGRRFGLPCLPAHPQLAPVCRRVSFHFQAGAPTSETARFGRDPRPSFPPPQGGNQFRHRSLGTRDGRDDHGPVRAAPQGPRHFEIRPFPDGRDLLPLDTPTAWCLSIAHFSTATLTWACDVPISRTTTTRTCSAIGLTDLRARVVR